MDTQKVVLYAAIGMIAVMLGVSGMIFFKYILPDWRANPKQFRDDLGLAFATSFLVAIAVCFMSFMSMLMAATHEQADISLYVFLSSGVYALVSGVICT